MAALPWTDVELSLKVDTFENKEIMRKFLERMAPTPNEKVLVNLYLAQWTLHNKVICVANDHPAVLYSLELGRRAHYSSF